MNPLLELRKQMEIDFLKTKTYEEINDMFNKLNDKLKIAEGKVKNISSNTLLEEGLTISSSELDDYITAHYEPMKEDLKILWDTAKDEDKIFENWWCDYLKKKFEIADEKRKKGLNFR